MTKRQADVLWAVTLRNTQGRWYRARTNGERVTLASLFRAGRLNRRAWRGIAGEPDAAYEYARPTYIERKLVH